ncbi:MAG: NUDIX hydrolase [Candidatus Andersenbacteria bacterium]
MTLPLPTREAPRAHARGLSRQGTPPQAVSGTPRSRRPSYPTSLAVGELRGVPHSPSSTGSRPWLSAKWGKLPSEAKRVFTGRIFSVWQWEQQLYNGSTAIFEGISRPDYVCAIGILPNQKLLLVEDEQPDRPAIITPAGGQLEPGEEPSAGAGREFREETGYEARQLVPWFTYQPNSKLFMTCHFFIARHLTAHGQTALEAGERITLKQYTFAEFVALGSDPAVRDGMLRIKLLEAQLDPQKKQDLHHLLYAR